MAIQVVVAPRAEAQIRTIDAWWRRNRTLQGGQAEFAGKHATSTATAR